MTKTLICLDCNKEVNGVIRASLTYPIAYYSCPLCGSILSAANISDAEVIYYLNEFVSSYDDKTVESMMYEPTKIDKDGNEYDMQPRSKR